MQVRLTPEQQAQFAKLAAYVNGGEPDPEPESEILTVPEAARLLRVNRNTLYDLIKQNQVPGVRMLGRSVRIHRPTLVAWFAAGHGRARRGR